MLTTNEQTELNVLLTVEEPNDYMKKRIAELQEKEQLPEEKNKQSKKDVFKNISPEISNSIGKVLRDPITLQYREVIVSSIVEEIKKQASKYYGADIVNILDTNISKEATNFVHYLKEQIMELPENSSEALKMQELIKSNHPYLETALKSAQCDYHKLILDTLGDADNLLELTFSIDACSYAMLLSLVHLLSKEYELSIYNRTVWDIAIANVSFTITGLSQSLGTLIPRLKLGNFHEKNS